MEFHPRVHPFSGNELAELVAISPDDAAMQQVKELCSWTCCGSLCHGDAAAPARRYLNFAGYCSDDVILAAWQSIMAAVCLWPFQGFHLQDPEVDDVIRTAKDLEAGYIDPDTSLTAEENVELLLRTTRLLQLGLEVQYAEAQTVLAENNTLRGDLRVGDTQCMVPPTPLFTICSSAVPAGSIGEHSMLAQAMQLKLGVHCGHVCPAAMALPY